MEWVSVKYNIWVFHNYTHGTCPYLLGGIVYKINRPTSSSGAEFRKVGIATSTICVGLITSKAYILGALGPGRGGGHTPLFSTTK